MNRFSIKKILIIASLSLLPEIAFAAQPTNPAFQWIIGLLQRVLDFIVWPLFLGLAVIMFIWAGILFLTSRGDASKLTSAKHAVIYGIIGVIVALFATSIVYTIQHLIAP